MNKPGRWSLWVGVLAVTGIALVIGFVLSFRDVQSGRFDERHFVALFWVTVTVAVLLTAVLLFAAARMVLRLKQRRFGSRLLVKLAGIFALVGILPGLVIYTVSYQFALRSIEAWFDVRLAGALDAGLALGKGALESLQADVAAKAGLTATRLGEERGSVSVLALERLREQLGLRDIALVGPGGQVLLAVGASPSITPDRPGPTLLRQARTGPASQIEGLEEEAGRARIRALALVPTSDITLLGREDRFVLVVQPLPRALVTDALAVQAAYSEYQQRALAREALLRMVIGTLTLAMVLSVFGAVLMAIVLGNQIARPLLLLADGVREVAAGNLSPKQVFASGDELGGLTRSFADMTQQLADARQQAQASLDQLEGARTRLQTILDNLTAGVIVFDEAMRIDTVNPGATRILHAPLLAYAGRRLDDLPGLGDFAQAVALRFESMVTSPEDGEREQWQDSFELHDDQPAALTLLARGALLPGQARLLVFDDITEVVSAQRARAWSEVARRVAHEIKNPLTPIQLSAERLQHKLEHRLEGADRALLERSVTTIVAQVQALKTLINEFRDYARLPAARPLPLELNTVVGEVLTLYGQAQEQGRLVARLGADLPVMLGDASQLRQVVHNLVQNALDAVADRDDGRVTVTTEVQWAEGGQARGVRLTVADNGPGFPDHVLRRAFEPYVTTKAKGTGLGLAVVKKIADEHRARIRLANSHEGGRADGAVTGARVSLSFSLLHQHSHGAAVRAA